MGCEGFLEEPARAVQFALRNEDTRKADLRVHPFTHAAPLSMLKDRQSALEHSARCGEVAGPPLQLSQALHVNCRVAVIGTEGGLGDLHGPLQEGPRLAEIAELHVKVADVVEAYRDIGMHGPEHPLLDAK